MPLHLAYSWVPVAAVQVAEPAARVTRVSLHVAMADAAADDDDELPLERAPLDLAPLLKSYLEVVSRHRIDAHNVSIDELVAVRCAGVDERAEWAARRGRALALGEPRALGEYLFVCILLAE